MHSRIRRSALIGVTGAALMAVAASPALATTATTLPATSITANSAVLNGSVTRGPVASAWEFQYGKTTSYGKATSIRKIPAGKGTVAVSAKITKLSPRTTYHFRLLAVTGSGSYYYPLKISYGDDMTFTTTKTGKLKLLSKTLTVKLGSNSSYYYYPLAIVSVPLKCDSTQSCNGKLAITTRTKTGKKFNTLVCATTSFSIPPGKKQTLTAEVSNGCLARLAKARHHKINGKLTASLSTGQPRISEPVILILK